MAGMSSNGVFSLARVAVGAGAPDALLSGALLPVSVPSVSADVVVAGDVDDGDEAAPAGFWFIWL